MNKKPTARKIIQIAATLSATENKLVGPFQFNMLYALCDDNTVWHIENITNKWIKVKDIPQHD